MPDAKQIPATKQVVDFVLHGPMCRDCADADGVCERSGLPCDQMLARRAVRYVIERINYAIAHGNIK
jgi:hypothetical protein